MARHLVVSLVGVVVEAPDAESARRAATLPLEHGALPNVVGIAVVGQRLARSGDEAGVIRRRLMDLSIEDETHSNTSMR